jgi:hypothetical protein
MTGSGTSEVVTLSPSFDARKVLIAARVRRTEVSVDVDVDDIVDLSLSVLDFDISDEKVR